MTAARRLLRKNAPFSRVEVVAFMALTEAFPEAPREDIAKQIGLDPNWDPRSAIAAAEKAPWFGEDLVNNIVGALVAPFYGVQAK